MIHLYSNVISFIDPLSLCRINLEFNLINNYLYHPLIYLSYSPHSYSPSLQLSSSFCRILHQFTMEDRKHTHNMGIYSKIRSSIMGCENSRDRSLEDGPGVVTKAFPCISLVTPGHFYWFYRFYGGRGLGNIGGLRVSFKKIYV